jgi:hypothetical protein
VRIRRPGDALRNGIVLIPGGPRGGGLHSSLRCAGTSRWRR